jgi:predicted AAA+ superfamily ATPase
MYLVFSIRPLTKNLPRAIQKPPKIYFFDNNDVLGDEGARFENLVATHLLKELHFREDAFGREYELRYLKDKAMREVDFAIVKDGNLDCLIEVKLSDKAVSGTLKYYAEKLKPRVAFQIVLHLKEGYSHGNIRVLSALEALTNPEILLGPRD